MSMIKLGRLEEVDAIRVVPGKVHYNTALYS